MSGSRSVEKEKSHALAFYGAMLLQSALVKKFAETNDEDGPRKRKLVSAIGNTLVCLIIEINQKYFEMYCITFYIGIGFRIYNVTVDNNI